MSQSQIRTRFIAFDLKLSKLPEREDLHIALGIANVEIAKILDVIAHHCGLTVMSISFASVPLVVKNAPDVAASIQGIAVFAGGHTTVVICQEIQMLLESHAVSKHFTESLVEQDEESDVIILELTFSL